MGTIFDYISGGFLWRSMTSHQTYGMVGVYLVAPVGRKPQLRGFYERFNRAPSRNRNVEWAGGAPTIEAVALSVSSVSYYVGRTWETSG
jgi:hypothetical protein